MSMSTEEIRACFTRELEAASLTALPIETFRKGKTVFDDWGGSRIGSREWVMDAAAAHFQKLGVSKLVHPMMVQVESWERSPLKPSCRAIFGERAPGLFGVGVFAQLDDGRFAAFGFGLPDGEESQPASSPEKINHRPGGKNDQAAMGSDVASVPRGRPRFKMAKWLKRLFCWCFFGAAIFGTIGGILGHTHPTVVEYIIQKPFYYSNLVVPGIRLGLVVGLVFGVIMALAVSSSRPEENNQRRLQCTTCRRSGVQLTPCMSCQQWFCDAHGTHYAGMFACPECLAGASRDLRNTIRQG